MNYEPAKKNIMAQEEFPLNDPPEFHYKLLPYGETVSYTHLTLPTKRIV